MVTKFEKQNIVIPGPEGNLEAVLHVDNATDIINNIAVICHPDPTQLGTMDNKVVTTVVRAFNNLGIACVRFNFRGVGNSSGSYGELEGEIADGMAIVAWVRQNFPNARLWLAGFSFGAYIATALATKVEACNLLTIAPPIRGADSRAGIGADSCAGREADSRAGMSSSMAVSGSDMGADKNYNFYQIQDQVSCRWLICMGDDDEVVASEDVYNWYERLNNPHKFLIKFANASHFFHGMLVELRNKIENFYKEQC